MQLFQFSSGLACILGAQFWQYSIIAMVGFNCYFCMDISKSKRLFKVGF